MGCGKCKATADAAAARQRVRAGLCCVCRHSRGIDPSECRGGSEPVSVALRVTSGNCPQNRYPNDAGFVRKWGVWWIGMPMPSRLWLALRHPKHPDVDSWPGCGCLKRLKEWWLRVGP